MPINPYINFAGTCREAVEYYAKVFQTEKPQIMTFGEMPPDPKFTVPEEAKNWVLHARLEISGTPVMFSDVFPGMKLIVGNNVTLAVVSTNRDEILNWFNKLREGGTVQMDLQQTFWSKLYGNLRDKYGIEWQLSLDSGETFPPVQASAR
jgi:PhnB protein